MEKPNLLKQCADAFPGMKATYDEVLKWRAHPGYDAKFDPFLNPQRQRESQLSQHNDEWEPVRTPEFELSRELDETMRDVYKHLYDALTDETRNGQERKLKRAYDAVVNFQKAKEEALTHLQKASIFCTRDQIAKLQTDLANRGKRLSIPIEQLEESFKRMNQWRSEDDPLKTMKLAQYINSEQREAHAAVVAEEDKKRIHVDAAEMIADIEHLARARGGFTGKGLWYGINNRVICPTGERLPGGTLMVCKDESEWKKLVATLPLMSCHVDMLKVPGTENYRSELTSVRHDGKLLTVMYWGIAIGDNNGEGAGDPRATLVPATLSGCTFVWPYVAIWAQIQQVDRSEIIDEMESAPTLSDGSADSAGDWEAKEPRVYKPEVKYHYPDGEVRSIKVGYYTESEHMRLSMYEHERLLAAKAAAAASDTGAGERGSAPPADASTTTTTTSFKLPDDLLSGMAAVSTQDAQDAADASDASDDAGLLV